MLRPFQIVLLLSLLLTSLSSAAMARMIIGVSPAVLPGVADRSVVALLQEEMASRSGEPLQFRSFDSEAAQLDWLVRFRELDAAVISRSLLRTLPAGTLTVLADLQTAVVVTHSGFPSGQLASMQRAFRSLSGDDRGRQLLSRLTGTTRTAPAASPAVSPKPVELQPARPAPKPLAAPPAVPAVATAPPATPPPTEKSLPPPLPPVTAEPEPLPKRPQSTILPAKPQDNVPGGGLQQSAKPAPVTPSTGPVAVTVPTAPKQTRLLLIAALVVLVGILIKITLLIRRWRRQRPSLSAPPSPPSSQLLDFGPGDAWPATSTPDSSATLATTVNEIIQSVHDIPLPGNVAARSPARPKTTRSRKHEESAATVEDKGTGQPEALRSITGNGDKTGPETPEEQKSPLAESKLRTIRGQGTAAGQAEVDIFPVGGDELIVERGRLGKTKVPALLKRCAELPQPVVLRVRTRETDICVHFAAGQICHAYFRDWHLSGENRQWDKLGYLMVREGLISDTQRDQARELIENHPELRLAEALRQLGYIDLAGLRNILARQAKTTVFFLTLFPEGEYRIEADIGTIPAEESIALQIDTLIREASQHQSEWTAIRKVLPKLDTTLDFNVDGHDKLEQVKLSSHQHLLLSQVDGKTPVGQLCSTSTLTNYEACRFLYLMVKAGVLRIA